MPRSLASVCLAAVLSLLVADVLPAQEGRVFNSTPDTVAIWEFNDLPGNPGDPLPNGTNTLDLSGHGLDATVEANEANCIAVSEGDPTFAPNTAAGRVPPPFCNAAARLAVNNDLDAFEMQSDEDFSIELYVRRAEVQGTEQWGILAGTWHSRTLIDDSVCVGQDAGCPDRMGAWYGYGFIRRADGGWLWVCSPVNSDGSLIVTSFNERRNDLAWDIPAGSHYVVASVNRHPAPELGETEGVIVYVDGVEKERVGLNPGEALVTPTGYEHGRFAFLTGEDDGSRGVYRSPPAGYSIDAARVQRRTIDAEEVADNWLIIQDGSAVPPQQPFQAVVTATTREPLVDQCVLLSAANSSAGTGNTITRYEWQIGAGAFEEGGVNREISFAAPTGKGGTDVTLRITNSATQTATASVNLVARHPPPAARIATRLGAEAIGGTNLILPPGAVLSLDGTGSSTPIPPAAMLCPLSAGEPLPPPAITEYRWDLDTNGSIDDTRPGFDIGPLDTLGQFTVTLTVVNAPGLEASTAINVKVADSMGNSDVFHNTNATILHYEFNNLKPGAVPGTGDVGTVPDLSGGGRDLTLVDPVGGGLEVQGGAPHLATNRALAYVGGGDGPRGEVRNDGGAFEFGIEDDFTFELYVKPAEADAPEWGDVAGTFRARVVDPFEDTARYGWGIIKAPGAGAHCWLLAKGDGGPGEFQVHSNWRKGEFNYITCVVARGETQMTSLYSNGTLVSQGPLLPDWSFTTPGGFPAALFYLFTREQQPGELHNCVPGTAVDALRLQDVALSAKEVAANWENICSGAGANPPAPPEGAGPFLRGDCNQDGRNTGQVTDGVFLLNFIFLGGQAPLCRAACDMNGDGAVPGSPTDAIYFFNFNFLGGQPIPEPLRACAVSTAPGDLALGCAEPVGCQ